MSTNTYRTVVSKNTGNRKNIVLQLITNKLSRDTDNKLKNCTIKLPDLGKKSDNW